MTTLGLLASWAAALFGGWAFVAGLVATPTDPSGASLATGAWAVPPSGPAARSARRALVASAIFAAVAAAVLLQLLLAGDFTVNYVARTMASNVPAGRRVGALFQAPAGAVLPSAALVALFGVLATRRARTTVGTAVAGSVVMALVAASLAAQPFATLPWVPTDGLGLSPALHQPLSLVGHLARSLAIAAAAASAARSADRLAARGPAGLAGAGDGDPEGRGHALAPVVALAAIAVAMWGEGRGAFLAGMIATPAPAAAWDGALVAALAAAACSWRSRHAGAGASLAASLGTLGLLVAALLAPPAGGGAPLALTIVAAASLVAAAAGALAAGQAAPSEAGRSLVVRLAGAGAVLLAAAGGAAALGLRPAGDAFPGPAAQGTLAAAILAWGIASLRDERTRDMGRLLLPACAAAGVAAAWWLAAPAPLPLLWGAAGGSSLGAAIAHAVVARARLLAWRPALLLAAGACASLAALGEGTSRTTERTVTVGTSVDVSMGAGGAITLAHQGVSRYQDGNAHVVAVALEATRGERSLALITAERREYVDGRDERLGPQTAPPAVLALPFRELRVTLDALAADEAVTLRLTGVALSRGWGAAILLLLAAVAVTIAGARSVPPSDFPRSA